MCLQALIRAISDQRMIGAEPRQGWAKLAGISDNGHILIVDDQREICELVHGYLTGEGYRVSTAQDGAELRRIMAQGGVDLVILELMLAGEDRLTVARSVVRVSSGRLRIMTGRGEIAARLLG